MKNKKQLLKVFLGCFFVLLATFFIFSQPRNVLAQTDSIEHSYHFLGSQYAVSAYELIDVEPDGDLDLVATAWAAGTALVWLENNGSGTFTSHDIYTPYSGSFMFLDAGDIDDDGDVDVVVSNRDGDLVYLFVNNGSESFTRSTILSSTDNPNRVRIRDIDNDGDKDVLVAWGTWTGSVWNGGIKWLDNNGSETFTSRTIDSSCEGCLTADAGDLDGDGDLDVVGGMEITAIAKYTNNGASPPSFTETAISGGTVYPNDVQIEDLDGDGDKDIAAISTTKLYWMENSGTGTFTVRTIATDIASTGLYIEVKDIDGDGDKDLLTASSGDGASWWRNNGDMTFVEKPITPAISTSTRCVSSGDVDGDSDIDLVSIWSSSSNIGWFELKSDVSDPTVFSLSPADNATGVTATSNLTINFSEPVTVQSGNILIKKTSDNSVFETIDVASAKVTGSGTSHITINPDGSFEQGVGYYVQIDATAFDDEVSRGYSGISDTTTWNFTAVDSTPPALQSLNPLDNASYVPVSSNLTLAFNENVAKGSGTIYLKKTSDNTTVESYSVSSSARVSVSGTNFVIDPTNNLLENTGYYVTVCSGCIKDVSNNSYTGFTGTTDWNFTSGDLVAPTISSVSSDKTAGTYKAGEIIDIDVTFSKAVTSTGNVTVTLETGDTDRTCTFAINNSSTGTCNYTVQEGDISSDLNATISGTIKDQSDNSLSNYTPATTLEANEALVIDATTPSGGSISYSDGFTNSASVALTTTDGSDTGTGLDTSSRILKRREASLSNGSCGSYGSFSVITPSGTYPNFTDTTVSSGNCYQYQYLIFDMATNQAAYTGSNTVKVDTEDPSVNAGTDKSKNDQFAQNATVSDSASGVASYLWSKQSGPGTVTFGTATAEDTTVSASEAGTYVIRLTVTDNSGNSSFDEFTLVWDVSSPTISNVSSNPSSDSSTVNWTTNEDSSSRIEYGLTTAYGNTTNETDTTTRVTNHSVTINGLKSCARYYFRVKSKDTAGNEGVSSQSTFNTTGCETSSIKTGNDAKVETSGGSVSVNTETGTAGLNAPNSFYTEDVNIQLNKLDNSSAPTAPTDHSLLGDNFFNLLAVAESGAIVDNFNQPITFTVTYDAGTETTYQESTLDVYKYSNGSWNKKNCTLDTNANTLSCMLNNFSTYAVFGKLVAETTEDNDDSDYTPIVAIGKNKIFNLSANESVSLKSKRIVFRGKLDSLNSGDFVRIFRNGEIIGDRKINKKKRWRFQTKQTKNTEEVYQFRYFKKGTEEEIAATSEYNLLIDGDSPRITNLSKSVTVKRGEYITWSASDDDQIKYHQVTFQGKKYNLNEARFKVPQKARRGVSRFTVKSFDRAENSATKKIMTRIK